MSAQLQKRTKILILAAALLVLLVLILIPPLYQDQSYHSFADQRTLLRIPNFRDVTSNLPFAIVGLMGLIAFRDFPARVVFFGTFTTAFGSV